MNKRMLIDGTHAEEVRVVITNGNRLEEYDIESSARSQLKGNIYLAKVTRVEPSLQAAFVDFGGNRHGFLAFNEIHPDYYQIPVEDREALKRDVARFEENAAAAQAHVESIDGELAEDDEDRMAARSDDEADADDEDAARAADPDDVESADDNEAEPAEAGDSGDDGDREPEAAAAEGEEEDESDGDDQDGGDAPKSGRGRGRNRRNDRRNHPMRRYKIQEVIKRRQILLVQVVKEERGNKGAALTTYLSLAGRYCVLMPNTSRNGGGVSRKITSAADRRKLRDTLKSLEVPEGMGVIMRTAGMQRNKSEIKRDFDYLMRLWEDVRELTLKSAAPALVYEEGDLIKRTIRDLYTREIEEVQVEGNEAYQAAKKVMRLMMPSHAKRVQPYRDEAIPLFHRYQVESLLEAMHSPVVQLKSGGYVVIDQTEALVAIDVNSGRSTKERNIEETALKTNLEAASEIARQLRLRDLAGLIVIDFIDMDESRNQRAVEKRFKEAVKTDRARMQLGRISTFGLLELSRQRMRPSLIETSTEICPQCGGTGHIRSIESMAVRALRMIEEEGIRERSSEIAITVPTMVALYILNQKRAALNAIEARYGFSVSVSGDDSVSWNEAKLERVKGRQGGGAATQQPAEEEASADDTDDEAQEKGSGRKRRRPRRRRKEDAADDASTDTSTDTEQAADAESDAEESDAKAAEASDDETDDDKPKRRRRGRRGGRRRKKAQDDSAVQNESENASKEDAEAKPVSDASATPDEESSAETAPAEADGDRKQAASDDETPEVAATDAETQSEEPETEDAETPVEEPAEETADEAKDEPEPARVSNGGNGVDHEPSESDTTESEPETVTVTVETPEEKPSSPPRRGWWQRITE